MSPRKSPKKSPKKKVKSVLVANDDEDVQQIVDKSHEKQVLKNANELKNEDFDGSTDDDFEESMSPFKNKTVINDNYFMAQSVRSKTSKNSFSKVMQNFDLSEEKINEIIENQFVSERKQIIETFINDFKKWFQLLSCGFNVLLYGVGSKRKLIDRFISECLQSEHHIVINGFNNEITVRHITSILSEVIDHDQNISDESKLIEKLKNIDFDLYLVIHSIDFMLASNPKIKTFFLQLVSKCSRLRLIASVDHINSGRLWSTTEANVYNWIWFNVPTFESYNIERAFTTGLLLSGSSNSWTQSLTYSSVKHVYDSLTSNAQKIFLLILNKFVDKNDSNNGFPFSECYTLCREEFLVNSEMTLRAQISEFKDHKLLKLKRGSDGGEVIAVCIDKSVAQKFIDNHK